MATNATLPTVKADDLTHIVIMLDEPVHLAENGYTCTDATCPCQDEADPYDSARYEHDFSYLEGTDAAWHV